MSNPGTVVAREAAEKAAKELAEKAAKEAAEKAAKEVAEKTAKEVAEKAAKEAAEKTAKEVAEKTAKEVAEKTAKEAAEKAAKTGGNKLARDLIVNNSGKIAMAGTLLYLDQIHLDGAGRKMIWEFIKPNQKGDVKDAKNVDYTVVEKDGKKEVVALITKPDGSVEQKPTGLTPEEFIAKQKEMQAAGKLPAAGAQKSEGGIGNGIMNFIKKLLPDSWGLDGIVDSIGGFLDGMPKGTGLLAAGAALLFGGGSLLEGLLPWPLGSIVGALAPVIGIALMAFGGGNMMGLFGGDDKAPPATPATTPALAPSGPDKAKGKETGAPGTAPVTTVDPKAVPTIPGATGGTEAEKPGAPKPGGTGAPSTGGVGPK